MKKSVRKELSQMVYKFGNDKDAAGYVYEAIRKMGVTVDVNWQEQFSYDNIPYDFEVIARFDPEDMQTPILQHNIKVILSRYEYALQVQKKISWRKKIFNFFKKIF